MTARAKSEEMADKTMTTNRAGVVDRLVEKTLLLVASTAIAALGLITAFILLEGYPVLVKTRLFGFIVGVKWLPSRGTFGILPMIAGSVAVTLGAALLGVPLGVACALFLSEVAGPVAAAIFKPAVELLAGIPSVVYGFIGLVTLVPLIRDVLGGPGFSVLAASVVLAVMILPTVVAVSYDALRAVPSAYREGMLALGATRWQTVRSVVLPAARGGILTATILGMGRAIGETMAVIMVAGNATALPRSLLDPVRTLTSNIALEMGYSAGEHRQALFATAVVLFAIISAMTGLARKALAGRVRHQRGAPDRKAEREGGRG